MAQCHRPRPSLSLDNRSAFDVSPGMAGTRRSPAWSLLRAPGPFRRPQRATLLGSLMPMLRPPPSDLATQGRLSNPNHLSSHIWTNSSSRGKKQVQASQRLGEQAPPSRAQTKAPEVPGYLSGFNTLISFCRVESGWAAPPTSVSIPTSSETQGRTLLPSGAGARRLTCRHLACPARGPLGNRGQPALVKCA